MPSLTPRETPENSDLPSYIGQESMTLANHFSATGVDFNVETSESKYRTLRTEVSSDPRQLVESLEGPITAKPNAVSIKIIAKRLFDIAFSLGALLLCSPLLFAIAIAVKLSSRGPVFFIQERVGLNGELFRMLKFRSMHMNEECDITHTCVGDPRITTVGGFLRRTSLDELPQFVNVLKGDMSVVGPRPELTHFVRKFRIEIPHYMDRHRVKGGITGWAQINGLRSSETSIPQRVQYDLEYLKSWSLRGDLKIIFLTMLRGLRKNAF